MERVELFFRVFACMEKDQFHKSEVTDQVSIVSSSPVISSSEVQTTRTDSSSETGMEIDTSNQESHGQKNSEKAGKDPLQSEELQDTRCLTTKAESNVVFVTKAGTPSGRKESGPNKELTSGMKKMPMLSYLQYLRVQFMSVFINSSLSNLNLEIKHEVNLSLQLHGSFKVAEGSTAAE